MFGRVCFSRAEYVEVSDENAIPRRGTNFWGENQRKAILDGLGVS